MDIFNQQNHPEIQEGEVWLTNSDVADFSEIGWQTKRAGNIAFDKFGEPIYDELFPVFVKKSELEAAGIKTPFVD